MLSPALLAMTARLLSEREMVGAHGFEPRTLSV
jgi:hypothetical protein